MYGHSQARNDWKLIDTVVADAVEVEDILAVIGIRNARIYF